MSANLPEDLSGRQSAEAEALERHTVFSTRVRAEALEQQKAEALKQQEAEALERQRLEAAASGSQSSGRGSACDLVLSNLSACFSARNLASSACFVSL